MAAATTPLPIRSALLAPGHDEERLRAAAASAADAIYVDLEAGVPRARLEDARALVVELLPALAAAGKLVVVRVNPISSGDTEADLAAVVRDGLYGIALAKIDMPVDVRRVAAMLDEAEHAAGVRSGAVVVHPVIESARAVRQAYRIARASTRVAHMGGIVAPGGDLARSLGSAGSFAGVETAYVREKVLVDARAAGARFPLSGIPVDRDETVLRDAALAARALGYEGLLIGYRSHAPIVNEVFTPTEEEVARWRAIVSSDGDGRRAPDAATRTWARERLAVAARFDVPGAS
jgi:citrate lyase subunit beta/citryl-CoA lyase